MVSAEAEVGSGERAGDPAVNRPAGPVAVVVFWHVTAGGLEYRWRLISASGETLERSRGGYPDRAGCERDVRRVTEAYPGAVVRDLTRLRV